MRSLQIAPDARLSGRASTPASAGVHHSLPCSESPPESVGYGSQKKSARKGGLAWLARLSPWLLIAGIAYAAVFIKPQTVGAQLPQPLIELRDMFFGAAGSPTSLWVVGQSGTVLHGQTGTSRWDREVLPTRTNLQAVAVSPNGRVVIAGNGGELWVKAPGADWSKASLPLTEVGHKLIDVQFISGRFWLVGEMGALFRSDSEGTSWERLGQEQDVAFNRPLKKTEPNWILANSQSCSSMPAEDRANAWTRSQAK